MGDVKEAEYTRTCAVFNNAGKRIGGTRKQATMGEVLCGGLFGVHEEGGYGGYAVLTHIPTGCSIGHSFQDERQSEALRPRPDEAGHRLDIHDARGMECNQIRSRVCPCEEDHRNVEAQ